VEAKSSFNMGRFLGVRALSIILALGGCLLLDLLSRHLPGGDYTQRLVWLAGLYVTLAVSLNLINGITGQFSIGHAAFYMVGAYLGGFLTDKFFNRAHLPDIVWLILMAVAGAIGAAIAGLLVGLPSLRLRGDYLAIVTLGFGEIIRIIVQNTNEIGGAYGLEIHHKIPAVWIVWMLAIICIAVSRNLLKTARGLLFLSVREDEIAASAMGVNVTKIKVTAFLLGSAFAGAAGALYAHSEGFITPTTFGMDVSFIILTMVVLGGTGSITGSIIAAVVLSMLPEFLRLNNPRTQEAITMLGSTVLATLLAVVVVVSVVKRIMDAGRGTKLLRFSLYMAAIIGGLAFAFIYSLLFARADKTGSLILYCMMALPFVLLAAAGAIWTIYKSGVGSAQKRAVLYAATVPGTAIFLYLLTKLLTIMGGPLVHKIVPLEQLRMVIFAVTLIVVMLLKPQGLLAHHEFSWSWVKKLFGIKAPQTAVST
jgi:branched-chain amino acid transport system permease protein